MSYQDRQNEERRSVRKPLNQEKRTKAIRLAQEEGLRPVELASRLGVDARTVSDWLKRAGVNP